MITLSLTLSPCVVAACLLAADAHHLPNPPAPATSTTSVVATLSVVDLELGVPFEWVLRAEQLADGTTVTYTLRGTSSGSVAVPMQAEATLSGIEARVGVKSVPSTDGRFALRVQGAEVATVAITAIDANATTYTVFRGGIASLRATTNSTQWAMADRSAPSLATVLAMLSVDPDGEDEAAPTNAAVSGCHPTFRECVSSATTACAPGKPLVSYTCNELETAASCSWDCGPAPGGQ